MRNKRFARPNRFHLTGIAIVTLALAACTDTRGGSIPYNVSDFGAPDPLKVQALASDYRIAPMDTLAIKVFGLPDLTGDYQVDLLGNVAMPLIGDVAAIDLTPAEFDALLTRKYSEKYLQNPDVSVGIKASAGRLITVDGSVKKGGAFPVIGPMTLMQAVALAGGTDENANQRRVAVFRTIDGQRQAAAFDLVSIRHGESPDPRVYSGDVIVIDGSKVKDAAKKFFQTFPLLNIFRPY